MPLSADLPRLVASLPPHQLGDLAALILSRLPDPGDRIRALSAAQLPPCVAAQLPGVVDAVREHIHNVRCDPLVVLPAEVGIRILEFIDHPRTLSRAAQVSRTWHRFARTPAVARTLARRFGFTVPTLPPPRPVGHGRAHNLEWLGISTGVQPLHARTNRLVTPSPPPRALVPPPLHDHGRDLPDPDDLLLDCLALRSVPPRNRRRRSSPDEAEPRPRKRPRRSAPEPRPSAATVDVLPELVQHEVLNMLNSLQRRYLATGISIEGQEQTVRALTKELGYLDRALRARIRPSSESQIGMSLLDSLEGIVRAESAQRRAIPLFAARRVFKSAMGQGVVADPGTRSKLIESLLFFAELSPTSVNIFDTQSFRSTWEESPRDECGVPVPELPGSAASAVAGARVSSDGCPSPRIGGRRRHNDSQGYVVMEKAAYDGKQASVSCLDPKGRLLDSLKPSPEAVVGSSVAGQEVLSTTGSHPSEALWLQYEVTRGWLDRGGRLLSQHYLYPNPPPNEVMITDMVADDDRIVLGMGNNAIHIIDARTGLLQETLNEHTSGVWCLALVPSWPSLRPSGYADQEPREAKPTTNMVLTEYDSRPEAYLEPCQRSLPDPFEWETTPWLKSLAGPERALLQVYRSIEQKLLEHPTWSRPRENGELGLSRNSRSSRRSSARPIWRLDPKYIDYERPAREELVPSLLRRDWTGPASVMDAAEETERAVCAAARNTQGLPNAPPITQENMIPSLARTRAAAAMQLEVTLANKPLLVSGGCDRTVIVWDLTTGERVHVLRGHTATVRCVSLLNVRGRVMAVTGSRDRDARLWDLRSGLLIHTFRGHHESIRCIAVSEDCEVTSSGPVVPHAPGEEHRPPLFATGSYDSNVRVWDAETGQCLHTLSGHSQQVYSIAFRRGTIVTGSLDTTVRVWDAVNGYVYIFLYAHANVR